MKKPVADQALDTAILKESASLHSRLRDEFLNRELLASLEDARWVVDRWRPDYNHHRMHSSLGRQTPAEFAARCLLTSYQE